MTFNFVAFRTNVYVLLIAWLKVPNLEHNRRNSMDNKKNNFRMTRLFFSSHLSVLFSLKLHSWDRVFVCRLLLNWQSVENCQKKIAQKHYSDRLGRCSNQANFSFVGRCVSVKERKVLNNKTQIPGYLLRMLSF